MKLKFRNMKTIPKILISGKLRVKLMFSERMETFNVDSQISKCIKA